MHLGELISQYRKANKMSMEDFGKKAGLSKAYISMLEKNENSRSKKPIIPSLETIKAVSAALGVDFNEVLAQIDPDTEVSVRPLFAAPAPTTTPIIDRTVSTMRRLSDEGQEIVANTADGLDKSGQYKRATEPSTTSDKAIPYRTVTVHTDGAVAAGYGAPNDWGTQQEHTVITSAANLSYDYAADIDGDSMSPTYEDGGLAYIKRTTDYRDGHIYAIKVNGEDYIKRCYFYKDHIEMVSDNQDYDPILPSSDTDDIKIIGEVVGYTPPQDVDA